jgi:DNA invertase Pin-like site-specific DNA recombinase
MPTKAAIWARVSTTEQEAENQIAQLRTFATRRDLDVVQVYRLNGVSAWKGSQDPALQEVLAAGRAGAFDVLLVWSLDRLERRGPLAALQLVDRLARAGLRVVSLQEEWVDSVSGELRDLLVALVGWTNRWESQRRSERTKAGLARAIARGKPLGRPRGAKDKRRRRRSGYFGRWADREVG